MDKSADQEDACGKYYGLLGRSRMAYETLDGLEKLLRVEVAGSEHDCLAYDQHALTVDAETSLSFSQRLRKERKNFTQKIGGGTLDRSFSIFDSTTLLDLTLACDCHAPPSHHPSLY